MGTLCLLASLAPSLRATPIPETLRLAHGARALAFTVATDELDLATPARRILQITPALPLPELVRRAGEFRAAGADARLVLYLADRPRGEGTRYVLYRTVAAKLTAGADPDALARALGVPAPRPVAGLRDWFVFETAAVDGAPALAEALAARPEVRVAEVQVGRPEGQKLLPNDTLFFSQWHLRNTGLNGGTPGVDLNVTNVWDSWRGEGVVIGVVDDAVQIAHPDLAPNVAAELCWDFVNGDADPTPADTWESHGTRMAGIAVAAGNNGLGVSGIAYKARLAGLRLLAAPPDVHDAEALLFRNDAIQIKNNSWGASDGWGLGGPASVTADALAEGVATGRDGKGTLYFFAAGNGRELGDDVNYDGYANSVYVSAVGAVNDRGQQAPYSEPGACLAFVAPSGTPQCLFTGGRQSVVTTDRTGEAGENYTGRSCELADRDYTQRASGTSSATPMAAGVAALLVQANPNLGWRDVKEILMRSARRVNSTDPEWTTNRAGLAHNPKFGAGLLNAGDAVALGANWLNLGPLSQAAAAWAGPALAIPDNHPAGVNAYFVITNRGFRAEHIALTLNLPHAHHGDLQLTLTAPTGTQSVLASQHASQGDGYGAWTFTSVRHWGEVAQGLWTLNLADVAASQTGTLLAATLTVHGSAPEARLELVKTAADCQLAMTLPAMGWSYALEYSTDLDHWTTLTTWLVGPTGRVTYTDLAPSDPQRFYRARLLP